MTRSGIIGIVVLGFAVSTGAQGTSTGQSGTTAQAQASSSVSASASTSPRDQSASETQKNSNRRQSASASAAGSSSASARAGKHSLHLAKGTDIQAALVSTLDAKHSKPGERVVARTTRDVRQNGKVVLKKGARITGHVTQVAARSKGNARSSIGVVFDNVMMKHGRQVPLHLSVQALAAAANQTATGFGDNEGAFASADQAGFAGSAVPSGGGLVGGLGGAVGGVAGAPGELGGDAGQMANRTTRATTQTAASATTGARSATGGLNAAGQLTSASHGVFGLRGVDLASATGSGTNASLVTSTTRNVHLASGTQMVLQVVGH